MLRQRWEGGKKELDNATIQLRTQLRSRVCTLIEIHDIVRRTPHCQLLSDRLGRRILALPPDEPPIPEQHPRHWQHQDGEEPEQARRPVNAQLAIHLDREQREDRPEDISQQGVARQRGRAVQRPVYVDRIQQGGHEDQDVAAREGHRCDDADHEVHVASRRPREPEEADGQEDGADHGRVEAVFGCDGPSEAGGAGLQGAMAVGAAVDEDAGEGGDGGAEAEPQEHEARLAAVEAVDALESVREGGKEGELDGEVEADVERVEAHDGLGEDHGDRAGDGDEEEEFDGGQAARWAQPPGRFETETFGPFLEDGPLVRLRLKQGQDPGDSTYEENGPLRPAPAFGLGGEATWMSGVSIEVSRRSRLRVQTYQQQDQMQDRGTEPSRGLK